MKPGDGLSLRRLSLASLTWWATVLLGWALVAIGVWQVTTEARVASLGPLLMCAALLVVLELLPLVQGRGHDPQGVVMSTAFVCATLVIWGAWPAIVMVSVASLAADLRARKDWWKTLFNPAQYSVSVAAGYLIVVAAEGPISLSHPLGELTTEDFAWLPGVWTAYFLVNLGLVLAVVGPAVRRILLSGFKANMLMTYAVLALSPLIVVLAQHDWPVLPLLLIPLLLLYRTAQLSVRREYEAGHDALTGLANRSTLQYELTMAFGAWRSEGREFGLLLIDMDDFKHVNDTLGHQVGDDLLVSFAERLRKLVRPGDFVARLGGDEFAVLVPNADVEDVRAVAERLAASVAAPIEVRSIALEMNLSIGVAGCPAHAGDAATLLQRADVAMYQAKRYRTGVEVYAPELDQHSVSSLSVIAELRRALYTDQLQLQYQPKMSTRDGSQIGVEALLRWHHPERGVVPPDQFIPLAERSGIMPLITERVISLALEQVSRWRAEGLDVQVAVNVTPTEFVGDELRAAIETALTERGLPPSSLKLEITERSFTHELTDAHRTLEQLRSMGVGISLDDFGTGYSSLMRLSATLVDEIKIDKVFIARMGDGEWALGVVRALIELAHTLGVPAIAEGVETPEELAVLGRLECDGVQGWHIARPMAAEQLTAWLRTRVGAAQPSATERPRRFGPFEVLDGSSASWAPHAIELGAADQPPFASSA